MLYVLIFVFKSKKEGAPKKRPQGSGAATPGLLPPPPGGVKLPGAEFLVDLNKVFT